MGMRNHTLPHFPPGSSCFYNRLTKKPEKTSPRGLNQELRDIPKVRFGLLAG